MWIYLVLVFSAGEPVSVIIPSIEECRLNVELAVERDTPHLEEIYCEVRDTEWKKHI
ncbi:hypothetical protein VPHD365_0203 [Vibrio phage D365]